MKLFDHQVRALRKLPATGGYLAFEQGLGKTLTAITFVKRRPDINRVLVIAPAVALGVWERELDQHAASNIHIPTGTRPEKARQIDHNFFYRGWLVLNYEALLDRKVEEAVRAWGPDLIILDESQKVKNSQAKRSKVLHRLTKATPALLLSGTPITKNLLDLYSQYKMIDPWIFDNESWTKFKNRYAIMGGYGGYEVIGYRDTDIIKEKIAPYTVVARKEDTLDLPTKTHQVVPVRLGGNDWDSYSKMAREGVAEGWVTSNPLEKALRLSQISGRAKLDATVEFVKGLREVDEPVVVYFRFRAEGDYLSEGLATPALTGDTPAAERSALVDAFQAGETNIFLAQVQAGSTAITLTRASHMVYHSLSYAYEDWAQSQDRIHRIGQDFPCTYYYMTATGPKGGMLIDQMVLNALKNKDDIAGIVTRDPALLLPKEAV